MSPFSLFLSSFIGCAKNVGIRKAMKARSGASYKKREKKEHLEEPSDWDNLHTAL